MAKRTLLEYKYEPEFEIIGIFSSLKAYRLAWLINQNIGFNLTLLPVFLWQTDESENGNDCVIYSYEHPETFMQVYLMGNRIPGGVAVQEFSNMDYVMLVKNPGDPSKITDLVKQLRPLPQVQMAVKLEKTPGRATTSMLYDLEMFLDKLNS